MSAKEQPVPLERVLHKLKEVRDIGGGKYIALCPSHDDHDPSLAVEWGNKGKVVMTCKAGSGCETSEILEALGMTFADLEEKPHVVARYDYQDADGNLVMQVERLSPKGFRQRRPNPDRKGHWLYKVAGLPKLPYRLPEVIAALADPTRTVYVVEGEKDSDALWGAVNALGTCNAGGAGKWTAEHSEFFRDAVAEVVIVADRDATGYQHALDVQTSLAAMGVEAAIVQAVVGKDAADHISDHGLDELMPLSTAEARELAGAKVPKSRTSTRRDEDEEDDEDLARLLAALPFPLTELGNAERLIERHGDDMRFVAPGVWLIYDGGRWVTDERGEVMRWLKDTVRTIRSEADFRQSAKLAKRVWAWAQSSESRSRMESALKLAQHEPGIAMLPKDFDADPMLLNVRNGTLDLRTGELRPHRREDHLRRQVPVDYDPDALSPLFDAFLRRVQPRAEMRAFIQRAMGYSATGSTDEQKIILLNSSGQSGKSTLVELAFDLFGPYATTLPAETLVQRSMDRIPNDIARLDGARFVSVIEFEDSAPLNERLVKQLTGGDTVTARFMRGEFFDFRPHCTIWVSSNHRPVVRGTDEGIWRRFLLVTFPVRIPDDERDDTLGARIRATELPGFLRWVVEGALAWQEQGLNPPASVLAATSDYRNDSDLLGAFLDEECVVGEDEVVTKSDLYERYVRWAKDGNLRPATKIAFGRMLKERAGLDIDDDRQGKDKVHVWVGVNLADRATVIRLAEVTALGGSDGDRKLSRQTLRPRPRPRAR